MESDKIVLFFKRTLMIILIFLMQTVFADKVRMFGVSPNFALAYILVVSFKNHENYGFYAALILGLLTDSVSGRVFGSYTAVFLIIEETIKYGYKKLFAENFFFECMGGLFFNFVFSFLFATVEWLFNGKFAATFLGVGLLELIYNQIVFMLFLFISKKFGKKKRRSMFRI